MTREHLQALFLIPFLYLVLVACNGKAIPVGETPLAAPPETQIRASQENSGLKDIAGALKARLVALGVPVAEIAPADAAFLKEHHWPETGMLLILLHSRSENDQITFEDYWNQFLADHEATLAYLNIGQRVSSYAVAFLDANGKKNVLFLANLTLDMFSQQLVPLPEPATGEQETQAKLADLLDLSGLDILSFEVQTGGVARENSRYINLHVSTPESSLEAANQVANRVSAYFHSAVDQLNAEGQAQISIARFRISDAQGNQLAEYIYEAETRSQSSKGVPGIDIGWFMEGVAATEAPAPTQSAPACPGRACILIPLVPNAR